MSDAQALDLSLSVQVSRLAGVSVPAAWCSATGFSLATSGEVQRLRLPEQLRAER